MKKVIFFILVVLSHLIFANDNPERSFNLILSDLPSDKNPISWKSSGTLIDFSFNEEGDVAFSFPEDQEFNNSIIGLYRLQSKKILWQKVNNLVGGIIINQSGDVLFENYDGIFRTFGIYSMKGSTGEVIELFPERDLARSHHRLTHFYQNGRNELFVYAKDAQNLSNIYLIKTLENGKSKLKALFQETFHFGVDGISYLYTPSFNKHGDVALKISYGQRDEFKEGHSLPHRIVLIDAGSRNEISIAEDCYLDENSPFERFSNSLSLNSQKHIAFIGYDKMRIGAIFFYDGKNVALRVKANDRQVKEILPFELFLSENDEILFLGKDMKGRDSLFLSKKNGEIEKVVTVGDKIETEEGKITISHINSKFYLNSKGNIHFVARFQKEEDRQTFVGVFFK